MFNFSEIDTVVIIFQENAFSFVGVFALWFIDFLCFFDFKGFLKHENTVLNFLRGVELIKFPFLPLDVDLDVIVQNHCC